MVGGLGPLAVALLSSRYGLQNAMLVIPTMYLASGLTFVLAEKMIDKQTASQAVAALAGEQQQQQQLRG